MFMHDRNNACINWFDEKLDYINAPQHSQAIQREVQLPIKAHNASSISCRITKTATNGSVFSSVIFMKMVQASCNLVGIFENILSQDAVLQEN